MVEEKEEEENGKHMAIQKASRRERKVARKAMEKAKEEGVRHGTPERTM